MNSNQAWCYILKAGSNGAVYETIAVVSPHDALL